MQKQNRLSRLVERFNGLPRGIRAWVITFAFGASVRFVRTAGVRFVDLTGERAVLVLRNRRRVQNHIGTIHAAAVALLGETASGAVFGMNVPDSRVSLLKSMRINYIKRSQGALKAIASLNEDACEGFSSREKGEVLIPVSITDETGEPTVECEYVWAWRPKK
jgi:acyl-coenzyme A thioesterase PaaI-like protein